jgi:starvation-inducible DNA-binding protein
VQSSIKKNIVLSVLCFMLSGLIEAKFESKQSEKLLQKILANHATLLFQTLNYHWNVEGKEFHDYHLLFDKQYNQLFANLDLIAERIRAIDGKALGSMKDLIKHATLKEDTGSTPKPAKMIKNLHAQYEKMINDMKQAVKELESTNDVATRKMLEDLIEQHEKTKWMLGSLKKK